MKMSVLPCICCEKNNEDSAYFGMPILKVNNTLEKPEFVAVCPKCGRGGPPESFSAETALKRWNRMQNKLQENGSEFLLS